MLDCELELGRFFYERFNVDRVRGGRRELGSGSALRSLVGFRFSLQPVLLAGGLAGMSLLLLVREAGLVKVGFRPLARGIRDWAVRDGLVGRAKRGVFSQRS